MLESKGLLKHREDGPRFVYEPVRPREATGATYLSHIVQAFFGGSPSDAVAALLGSTRDALTPEELRRLQDVVARFGESRDDD